MKIASIILCAGASSRLKSSKSKILHEICGRPVAYWPIKHALETTSVKPIVVIGHQAEEIEAVLGGYFQDSISFAYQRIPDGTGGAVKAAVRHIDESCQSVLVIYGDTPLLKKESIMNLITIQQNSHVPIAMLSAVAADPSGYGRIIRNNAQQIVGIVEDQDATPLEREIKEVNPGVYVFEPKFLCENISRLKPNSNKQEYYLTDLVQTYMNDGAPLGPVNSIEISYEEMQGINDRRQLAYAQKVLNRRLLDQWMLNGVTFIDPDHTYIEEDVQLAQDVVIFPGVHLRGQTQISEGVIIENGSIIIDTVVEKNVHIFPYTWCDRAHIGERSQVGPFARLRPEARLDHEVKVGNFVEIKRSHLKKGVKVGHLAYLGDAELGEKCNIGAGTIACNFDGQKKHETVIGDHAFIGSNTTLIAPLVIGENSYIGGGSTIDQDVPKGALAIGRARQVNKLRKEKVA